MSETETGYRERHEATVQALAAARAEVQRLTYLLGSHADGHRCTCTMTDPGKPGIAPPEWEQDPWCLTHPDMGVVRTDYDAARAEVAALRSAVRGLRTAVLRVWALERRWTKALGGGCPSCGPVGGCDHIEGYHHALSDLREAVGSSGESESGEVAALRTAVVGINALMDEARRAFVESGPPLTVTALASILASVGSSGETAGMGVNDGMGNLGPRGADDAPDESKGRAAPTADPAPMPALSVGSSGETESGERWECQHKPRCADAACPHNPAMQRIGAPAPVSSGETESGWTDSERSRCHDAECRTPCVSCTDPAPVSSGAVGEIRHCDGCGEDYDAFEESHVGHEVTPAPVSSGGQADDVCPSGGKHDPLASDEGGPVHCHKCQAPMSGFVLGAGVRACARKRALDVVLEALVVGDEQHGRQGQ